MRKHTNTNLDGTTPSTATGGTGLSYTLSVDIGGEALRPVFNLREAMTLVDGSSNRAERGLVVIGKDAQVFIHLHSNETTLEALRQSNAELSSPSSYFDVGFESPEQEALARWAIPVLLQQAERLANPGVDVFSNLGRCIRTQYRPATNHRGACIRAWLADDGKPLAKVRMSWNHGLEASENHLAAAKAVLATLRAETPAGRHWSDAVDLRGGYLGKGEYAFVLRRSEGGAL